MGRIKPYKASTITGAEREVRRLRKLVEQLMQFGEEAHADRKTLAKLAADGPCFDNPLVAFEAKSRRDAILAKWCGLKPDGTRLQK